MTSKHEPFDETAKAFYRRFFKDKGLLAETEREVFFRGRKIDLVVTCSDSELNLLQNTIFSHFRGINILELKGPRDPLTLKDYNRILMRAWGLGGIDEKEKEEENDEKKGDVEDEIEDETEVESDEDENEDDEVTPDDLNRLPHRRTLTIVSVVKPRKILNTLKKELNFSQTEPGIYYCEEGQINRWIICPSELLLVEKNYPLLPLARGKKLAEFISICVRDRLVDYLELIKDIGLLTDPNLIWQKILENQDMKPKIKPETWSYIDQFFQEMPEAMTKLPTVRQFVQQDVQQAVQDAQQAVQDAQQAAQQAIQAAQQAAQDASAKTQRRILIRLLHHKFASVPKIVVQKIEATDDIEQLDNWLDQVIVADSLAETELVATDKSDNVNK